MQLKQDSEVSSPMDYNDQVLKVVDMDHNREFEIKILIEGGDLDHAGPSLGEKLEHLAEAYGAAGVASSGIEALKQMGSKKEGLAKNVRKQEPQEDLTATGHVFMYNTGEND